MADHTSGFNVATYVSWHTELSGLCGLTEDDVLAALRLPSARKSEVESLSGGEPINPKTVSNSKVSESALQILAASPVATNIVSDNLENPENCSIRYESLVRTFHLFHLAGDIATSKSAWLSYMFHIGGLAFGPEAYQLRTPNLIAAERFDNATLDCAGLRLEDVDLAFQNIVSIGDISQALKLYKRTMSLRDTGASGFSKKKMRNIIVTLFTTLFSATHTQRCKTLVWRLKLPSEEIKPKVPPCRQLQEYPASHEIARLKKEQEVVAYLIVVVGSRQILFWKMDNDEVFQEDPQLAA
ncbi:hypothetical protein BGX27_001592 [Mortierella sp. AM989]|nr:hypothetical protein BGX27_001592 [Mortierella sp. AM989]